ncbi:carbamoyltransferase [Candidatus Parcubacteria bacterium]|nr:carbamoyltransferase [Candidatus Parcubacteria bacterium]
MKAGDTSRPEYIIGLTLQGHDTAACLTKDGAVVAFIEEERLNRQKHTRVIPFDAIDAVLRTAGISMSDVSYVGVSAGFGVRSFWNRCSSYIVRFPVRRWPMMLLGWFRGTRDYLRQVNQVRARYGLLWSKIVFVPHHEAHLASAFLVSPFERAAILSIDGSGEGFSSKMALGEGNRFVEFGSVRNPESIGIFYLMLTQYLGFSSYGDEGKVMGLAAYGTPRYAEQFAKILQLIPGGTYRMNMRYFSVTARGKFCLSKKFYEEFGPARAEGEPITERHEDLAASLQKVTEETIIHLVNYVYDQTHEENLCLAGGVIMNSVTNGMLHRRTPFKEIFIQPLAYDAGNALGCCYYIYHQLLHRPRTFVQRNIFWGTQYTDEEIEAVLKKWKLRYQKVEDSAEAASALISQGKVVGWFQGRMEAGARALGHRSILADPRRADMKDIVNKNVKNREPFRPFAPAILEEKIGEYFEDTILVPYMERVFTIKLEKRSVIPAVTHVDGTGRLQTVSRKTDPLYYAVIEAFEKKTGVPIVLNTSFNVKGEPLVCRPEEALRDFFCTGMDALFIGSYLLQK